MSDSAELIRDIMSREVISVSSSTSVKEALRIMIENDVGSILVTKNRKAVGILTERDISHRTWEDIEFFSSPVESAMSQPLISATPDMTIWDAMEIMIREKIRRLPVIENDILVGIVTQRDLLRWALDSHYSGLELEKMRELARI